MKFRKLAIALGAVMALSTTAASAKTLEFTVGDPAMYISDGTIETYPLEAAPYIENGRTMVPIRVISENFGADVNWDAETRTVTIENEKASIVLTIDSLSATVNGEVKTLDAAPVITNDRTMVPLRFISEALNRSVEYVEPSAQILISDEDVILTVNGVPITLDDYRFLLTYYDIGNSRDVLSIMIPEITDFLAQNYSLANAASAANSTADKEELDNTVAQLIANKDAIYKTSLLAPGIKLLRNDQSFGTYINNYDFGVTDETAAEEYNNNYICAKHILILTTDAYTGEPKSDAEKKEAKATADDILKKVKKGEDFDALIDEYNEDPGMASYPDGYVFTYNEMVKEFEDAAYALKVGETSEIVESNFGYHIIKRCDLPELDEATLFNLKELQVQNKANKMVADIVSQSEIVQLVSDEQIIEMLAE